MGAASETCHTSVLTTLDVFLVRATLVLAAVRSFISVLFLWVAAEVALPQSVIHPQQSPLTITESNCVIGQFLLYRRIEELTQSLNNKEQHLERLSTEKRNLLQCLEESHEMEVQVMIERKVFQDRPTASSTHPFEVQTDWGQWNVAWNSYVSN